jgi:hypothetical protein
VCVSPTNKQLDYGIKVDDIFWVKNDVVVLCIKAGMSPVMYDNRYYQRIGSNIEEVKPAGYLEFFPRFT